MLGVVTLPLNFAFENFISRDAIGVHPYLKGVGGTLLNGYVQMRRVPDFLHSGLSDALQLDNAEVSWKYCPSWEHGILRICIQASSRNFRGHSVVNFYDFFYVGIKDVKVAAALHAVPSWWVGYPPSIDAVVDGNFREIHYDIRKPFPLAADGTVQLYNLSLGLANFSTAEAIITQRIQLNTGVAVRILATGKSLEAKVLAQLASDGSYTYRAQITPHIQLLRDVLSNYGPLRGDTLNIEGKGQIS